jgi:hypothetical protein
MTVVPRAGHNDLFEQGAWARVSDFLAGLETEAVAAEVQSEARAGRPVEVPAAAAAEH